MKQQKTKSNQDFLKPVQHKYNNAINTLNRIRWNRNKDGVRMTVEQEIEVAYLINRIETYGFDFFPNHYIFDDVVALENIIKDCQKH